MKALLIVSGFVVGAMLAPIAALAQDLGQPGSTPGGTLSAPVDDGSMQLNANPFMGAAGADKYYQHNALSAPALPPPDSGETPNSDGTLNNPAGLGAIGADSDIQKWATSP